MEDHPDYHEKVKRPKVRPAPSKTKEEDQQKISLDDNSVFKLEHIYSNKVKILQIGHDIFISYDYHLNTSATIRAEYRLPHFEIFNVEKSEFNVKMLDDCVIVSGILCVGNLSIKVLEVQDHETYSSSDEGCARSDFESLNISGNSASPK